MRDSPLRPFAYRLQLVLRAFPGSVSGTRFAGAGSLWPDPFPPSPPPPSIGLCSETSPVLWVCPTSRVRSSSAFVLRLPDTARFLLLLGRTRDLPVPVPSVSLRGLRPRGIPERLALAASRMLPSAHSQSVGIPK